MSLDFGCETMMTSTVIMSLDRCPCDDSEMQYIITAVEQDLTGFYNLLRDLC